MILGTILLVIGLLAALAGAAAAFLVIRGDRAAMSWARGMTYLALAGAALASILLMALILAQRYDIDYIYQFTSSDLNTFYRISAFWAGQQGSFLLWLLLGSILSTLQIRRSRQFEPYVLLFLLLVQAGLSLFLLVESPFRSSGQNPIDGYGLNPLLQNPWMVSHPPVLFVGYAGLAIPFAYALGGLWRRDYDEWVKRALPWTLMSWFFLGLGIYLGAYWAYETLGWGGYWGWDLVENSSFIPWLTGTALLHGMLIQRYRRRLRHGNFLLAIATFLLVVYATYLTRSGVLSEISTHSFVESNLNPWMIGVLIVLTATGLGLLVSRWLDIPRGPVFASLSEKPETLLDGDVAGTVGKGLRSWLSRDFTFLLTILTVLLLTAPIWVGTLVPVITRLWGPPDALDTSFYPRTTAPSLVLLLAVLSLCPLLGWQGSTWKRVRRFLGWAALAALLITVASLAIGARQPLSLVFIFLGAFALITNLVMIVRIARGGPLRMGGYLAHVGTSLLVVGIIASSVYDVEAPPLALTEGKTEQALDYRFTFVGWQETPGENPALRLEVEGPQGRFTALPELYTSPQDGSLVATPHVRRYLTHDVYIAAEGYEPAQTAEAIPMQEGDTVQEVGYNLTLRSLLQVDAQVQAVLTVETNGLTTTLTPTYSLDDTAGPRQPASLPGGEVVTIEEVYLPPPGLLLLVQGEPVPAGPYTVTLQGFQMQIHDAETGDVAAVAVLEIADLEGTFVITPAMVVGENPESPPVEIAPGITVRLVDMNVDVDPRVAWIQVDGLDLPRQISVAWLRVESPAAIAGVARVHVSIKPGMNLLWMGGVLLLLGTGLATARRWWEGR